MNVLVAGFGVEHSYSRSLVAETPDSPMRAVEGGIGILQAALDDYRVSHNFKDAAAVIAGSILEEHLRALCAKHGLAISVTNHKGKSEPKKASVMNDDLKQTAYNQIEWRTVQGWLDIRNDAAHGNYGSYDIAQVELMIEGIRGFMSRHSA